MSNGQQCLGSAKLHLLMMAENYCLGVLSGHGRRSRETWSISRRPAKKHEKNSSNSFHDIVFIRYEPSRT
jgi:hypothetical protein